MNLNRSNSFQLDWIAVIIFTALVVFGYFNILSASNTGEFTSYIDTTKPYGKQLLFIMGSLILIATILSVEAKFYERFASILYIGSILSLIGLFIFAEQPDIWTWIGGIVIFISVLYITYREAFKKKGTKKRRKKSSKMSPPLPRCS